MKFNLYILMMYSLIYFKCLASVDNNLEEIIKKSSLCEYFTIKDLIHVKSSSKGLNIIFSDPLIWRKIAIENYNVNLTKEYIEQNSLKEVCQLLLSVYVNTLDNLDKIEEIIKTYNLSPWRKFLGNNFNYHTICTLQIIDRDELISQGDQYALLIKINGLEFQRHGYEMNLL